MRTRTFGDLYPDKVMKKLGHGVRMHIRQIDCVACDKAIDVHMIYAQIEKASDITTETSYGICSSCERLVDFMPAIAPDGEEGLAFYHDGMMRFIVYDYPAQIWRSHRVLSFGWYEGVENFDHSRIELDWGDTVFFGNLSTIAKNFQRYVKKTEK